MFQGGVSLVGHVRKGLFKTIETHFVQAIDDLRYNLFAFEELEDILGDIVLFLGLFGRTACGGCRHGNIAVEDCRRGILTRSLL